MSTSIVEKLRTLATPLGHTPAPEWVENELLSDAAIGQTLVFGEGTSALGALIVPSSAEVTDNEIVVAINRTNLRLPEYAKVQHWTKVAPFTVANRQLSRNGRLDRAVIEHAHGQRMTACLKQRGHYVDFFQRLVAVTTPGCARLREMPQVRDGLAGLISRSTYLQFLAETYYHVKHAIGLVHLACETLAADNVWLREALGRYIAEKTGHEEWILDDIAQVGGDAELVRHGTPRFATELMVAYAYDFVRRVNPMGIFGMVFVIESTGALLATRVARALMQTLRLPESCFSYLLSHRAMDVERARFLENLMFRIDDPRDQVAVIRLAKAMYELYANLLDSIPG